MTATATKLGRKDALTSKVKAHFLTNLDTLTNRYYAGRLMDEGFISQENIPTGKQGRPPVRYILTGKGKGFLSLASKWNKQKDETVIEINPFEIKL